MTRTMTVALALAWTMAAGVAHAAMQKGDVVPVATESSLKTRPTPDAEDLAPAPVGTQATLSVRISNTSGDWWYVEVGGKKGWLPESALAAAPVAPVAPAAPVAAPIPPPGPVPTAAPVATTPTATPAQTPRRRKTDAGSDELGLAFEFADDDLEGLNSEYLNLDLRYGYCYTDVSEFGLQASYSRTSIDEFEFSSDSYLVGPFFVHNIASSSPDTTPFVGVLLGITQSDFLGLEMDGQVLELSGGMRYFAADDFSVNFSAYYRKSELDFEGYDLDGTTFGFRIGVSGFIR